MSNANPLLKAAGPASYRGTVIDVTFSDTVPLYAVSLLRADGSSRIVARTADETTARRIWCLLARVLRCPRLVAEIGGGVRAVETPSGSLVIRAPVARRKPRPTRRRPASRRTFAPQTGRRVHAGEREIICYE